MLLACAGRRHRIGTGCPATFGPMNTNNDNENPTQPLIPEPQPEAPGWASVEEPADAVPVARTAEVPPVPPVPTAEAAAASPAPEGSGWSVKKSLAIGAAALGIAVLGAAGGATAVALTHDNDQSQVQNGQYGPGSGQVDPDGDNWQGGGGHHGMPPGGVGRGDPNGGTGQVNPNGDSQTTPNGGAGGSTTRQAPTLPGSSS